MKRQAAALLLMFLAATSVPGARADERPVTPSATLTPVTDCPRLNCDPVPCEWYPGGWPIETLGAIGDPSTWWQFDPNGTCATEVPANAAHTPRLPVMTLPPTDAVR